MRNPLHTLGLLGLLLTGLVSATDAEAQDDRRVLKARQIDQSNLNEAYLEAARAKRLESIEYLKKIIAENPVEGDKKAEMLLRLADLYFEQGRDQYLLEMKAFDTKFDACFNTEGCNTETLKPDNTESQKWQERSIKLYQQILASYPRFARADEATFFLGSALMDVGRKPEGVQHFDNLTKTYPDSKFVPDAYILMGEYYFDDNNAYKALTNYKKATAYPNHDKYGFALYKLAWSYYNVGEYSEAIDKMKAVVSYSMAEGQAAGAKLQLQDEALKDLVRFFADAGELDQAYAYFGGLGKKDLIRSMLKRLGATYMEQGKWEDAVNTFRRLIAEEPSAKECPDYQDDIINAYNKMGKTSEVFGEIDKMVKTYGKDSAWARANASDPEAIKSATEKAEKQLRKVAFDNHNRAKKLKTGDEAKQAYAYAYRGYQLYLETFPASTELYEVTYSFAELLYTIKKYEEAYTQYMAVVKIDPQGKHSRFCAESAIFAADEMVKKEGGDTGKPAAGTSKSPQPLTEWEQRLVDACKQYATLFPSDPKVKNVIYKSGYLLYNKYQFELAAEQFNAVIKTDPKSKEAEQAANLILDSFVVNEDWTNLKKNAEFYYKQEGLGSPAFKKDVHGIYQRASLKIIEVDFEKTKDHSKTADALVAFSKEFPESEENARVLNNASIYYYQANRAADSMAVRKVLVDDPKYGAKTKYYYDQVAALAYDYENIANFAKAAEYYERLFTLYPKHKEAAAKAAPDSVTSIEQKAADAIYSAAVFRRALGDWQGAVNNYKQFLAAFPADARANDVQMTIGTIYEEQQQWVQSANVFYTYYTKAPADTALEYTYFARLHYAHALNKQGQAPKALKVYEETVALYQKFIAGGGQPGPYTEFVAEMMYALAESQYQTYAALVIGGIKPGTPRKQEDKMLGDALKKKAEALGKTEKLYTDIIKTGAGEWGIAALVRLGQVYENMGESLKTSHVPTYLTDDQREIYQMAIEDKVYPQIEKAVAAYSSATQKSYELTLYNDKTAFATRRLGELRPDDFPALQEELPKVQLTSSPSREFPFETQY